MTFFVLNSVCILEFFLVLNWVRLGNPANIKVENSGGAVGYVGSFLMTVHNPLFSLYYKL